ncbi:MAG: hypothetical protein ACI4PO_06075 [Faecousia sp.]
MDEFIALLEPFLPQNLNVSELIEGTVILCAGIFVIGLIGRLFFGKKSVLNQSVSSAIGILFIYIVTIVIYSTGVNLGFLLSPLPFISLSGENMYLFNFLNADYTDICYQLLNMIVLSFLTNLVHEWLPTGKKLVGWYFYRCLTVLLAMVLHLIVSALLNAWLPEDILTWAPTILLFVLLAMMFVGALKLIVSAALSFISPVIAILYTFFFTSSMGKKLSKAVLTTALVSGLILILNLFDISVIYIGASALTAYIPLLIILLIIWYVIGHLF